MSEHLFESREDEVMRLLVIRHARTAANVAGRIGAREDYPLDEAGRAQAEALQEKLAVYKPVAVYSSPQLRAADTAEIASEKLDIPVHITDNLMEYSLGVLEGMLISEIKEKHPDLHPPIDTWLRMQPGDPVTRPDIPGAESMANLVGRVMAFANRMVEQHPGECVAMVTHLALIKALFTTVSGGTMRDHSAFLADNASVSVIDFYNRMPVIRGFNDISHLQTPLKYGKVVII